MIARTAILLGALLTVPAGAEPAPETGAAVAREIAMLQFFGGGTPLTPAERADAARAVATASRRDPAGWAQIDRGMADTLAKLARADAGTIARIRLIGRTHTAFPTPGYAAAFPDVARTEAAIVAAHDPAVVTDAAHQRVITRYAVARMVDADRAAAPLFGVAPPGPADALAREIGRSYPHMDAPMQEAMAEAAATLPAALPYLMRADAHARAGFVAHVRPLVEAGTTGPGRDMRLAQVLATTGRKALASGGGVGAGGGFMALEQQRLLGNAMLGASRSFSPRCNVWTGSAGANPGFCHP